MTINVAEHTECSKPVDRTALPFRVSSARRRTIDCNRAADRVGPEVSLLGRRRLNRNVLSLNARRGNA
jgi:hypothetical protein